MDEITQLALSLATDAQIKSEWARRTQAMRKTRGASVNAGKWKRHSWFPHPSLGLHCIDCGAMWNSQESNHCKAIRIEEASGITCTKRATP